MSTTCAVHVLCTTRKEWLWAVHRSWVCKAHMDVLQTADGSAPVLCATHPRDNATATDCRCILLLVLGSLATHAAG